MRKNEHNIHTLSCRSPAAAVYAAVAAVSGQLTAVLSLAAFRFPEVCRHVVENLLFNCLAKVGPS